MSEQKPSDTPSIDPPIERRRPRRAIVAGAGAVVAAGVAISVLPNHAHDATPASSQATSAPAHDYNHSKAALLSELQAPPYLNPKVENLKIETEVVDGKTYSFASFTLNAPRNPAEYTEEVAQEPDFTYDDPAGVIRDNPRVFNHGRVVSLRMKNDDPKDSTRVLAANVESLAKAGALVDVFVTADGINPENLTEDISMSQYAGTIQFGENGNSVSAVVLQDPNAHNSLRTHQISAPVPATLYTPPPTQ